MVCILINRISDEYENIYLETSYIKAAKKSLKRQAAFDYNSHYRFQILATCIANWQFTSWNQ